MQIYDASNDQKCVHCHGPRTLKEVSAYRGRCIDARDKEYEAVGFRISEGHDLQMR
jgi:recombinational DNA repair protein (RecF pathway)